ncbi:ABC transporter ATP-binding protein [soil metagenome]
MPERPGAEDTPPVLRCERLRTRFDDRVAVDDVGFEIAKGECYGLLGPNGAGKTTTISLLCGLLTADAGEVLVAGHRLADEPDAAKAALGYVPQEIALYPDLSAVENLRFFGRLYGLTGAHLTDRVAAVLDVVGLADRADERVDRYSGGMRRRANIAAGLLHEPELLVLDEPTVGVDPQSRNAILEAVDRFGREGLSVLYTTHYIEEAERLCDRVGIIDEGRLVVEGTRRELVARVGERDRVVVEAEGDLATFAARCREVPGAEEVSVVEGGVEAMAEDGRHLLATLLATAAPAGAEVTGVRVVEADLESVFLHLTGKALRD